MKYTKEQNLAINLNDKNLLISASAGSGKTTILIERICRLAINEKVDINKFMIVTFTELAAKEMKSRLVNKFYSMKKDVKDQEILKIINKQINMIHNSNISTLHSFCKKIIEEYSYLIDIDTGFKILDNEGLEILQKDALDKTKNYFYKNLELYKDKENILNYDFNRDDFINCMRFYSGYKSDKKLLEIVQRIYSKIASKPDMNLEFEKIICNFENKYNRLDLIKNIYEDIHRKVDDILSLIDNERKREKFVTKENCEKYINGLLIIENELENLYKRTIIATPFFEIDEKELKNIEERFNFFIKYEPDYPDFRKGKRVKKEELSEEDEIFIENTKQINDIFKNFIKEIKENYFFKPFDESIKDIEKNYKYKKIFKLIILEYHKNYIDLKKNNNCLDFNDLEHKCIEILENTEALKEIKRQICYIFIDEYQDINDTQEYILTKLKSNDNVFQVGDAKQSIYGFRNANINIFLNKYNKYNLYTTQDNEDKICNLNQENKEKDVFYKNDNHFHREEVSIIQKNEIESYDPDYEDSYEYFVNEYLKKHKVNFSSEDYKEYVKKYISFYKLDDRVSKNDIKIDLNYNFRSEIEILNAINAIFTKLMSKNFGSIDYKNEAMLKKLGYNNLENVEKKEKENNNQYECDKILKMQKLKENELFQLIDEKKELQFFSEQDKNIQSSKVFNIDYFIKKELNLNNLKPCFTKIEYNITNLTENFSKIDIEIAYLVNRIKKLLNAGVKENDIVILSRSKTSFKNIQNELLKLGINSVIDKESIYFEIEEIAIMLNFLKIIDNPYNDIELLSVMHSYFGKFTYNELYNIRLEYVKYYKNNSSSKILDKDIKMKISYYESLKNYENLDICVELKQKIKKFLEMLEKYRKLSYTIKDLIDKIIRDFNYDIFLLGKLKNNKKNLGLDNLKILINIANENPNLSIYEFLEKINKIKYYDINYQNTINPLLNVNSIKIMSIHKAKGLEFDYVFLVNAYKSFNKEDIQNNYFYDDRYGLSLKKFNIEKDLKENTIDLNYILNMSEFKIKEEEQRILYVALTRAKKYLEVIGVKKQNDLKIKSIYEMESYGDWIEHLIDNTWNTQNISLSFDSFINKIKIKENDKSLKQFCYKFLENEMINEKESNKMIIDLNKLTKEEIDANYNFLYTLQSYFGNYFCNLIENNKNTFDNIINYEDKQLNDNDYYIMLDKISKYEKNNMKKNDVLPNKISVSRLKKYIDNNNLIENSKLLIKNEEILKTQKIFYDIEEFKNKIFIENQAFIRGNVYHHLFEFLIKKIIIIKNTYNVKIKLKYKEFVNTNIDNFINEAKRKGFIIDRDIDFINKNLIKNFLTSNLVWEVFEADKVYAEQTFMYKYEYLEGNFTIIQGIIDLMYLKDNKLVLVDYKSDKLRKDEDFINKYDFQLQLYGMAMKEILGFDNLNLKIYSINNSREINLEFKGLKNFL